MEEPASKMSSEEDGVFTLLSALCNNVASKYCHQRRISRKYLAKKMRTQSYEIILKKSDQEISTSHHDPVVDLMCYHYNLKQNLTNVAQYKRYKELKEAITTIHQKDFSELRCVFKFLVELSNTVKKDLAPVIYDKPFSFGLFNEMLPKPEPEVFGSPEPYPYFPTHVFNLPYSLNRPEGLDVDRSNSYTKFTVETFDSRLSQITSQVQGSSCLKSFLSPMCVASLTSTEKSPYCDTLIFNYPRLTAPRDLIIPSSKYEPKVKESLARSTTESDNTEVFNSKVDETCLNIWELASQVDKNVPDNIWDIVSKMPPLTERQLIASSSRELCLWHQTYGGVFATLSVATETHFIRHLMYLIIGVETSSFPFNEESGCFRIKEHLVIEGVSRERLGDYVCDLLLVGTYYRRLYRFAFNHDLEDYFHSQGLIYEAAREVVRCYLLKFRLRATEIYEECNRNSTQEGNCIPTLFQIRYHLEPLQYQIETVASIYQMIEPEPRPLPRGAELMSYLFDEISLITHKESALTMFTSLFTVCKVYFKFIERFIFEGELDDRHSEFFVRKDTQYASCCSKRYWDRGFHIAQGVAIPEFLKPVAKFILLCGKSLRLLKLCNPTDPLVLLISSDHPSVKCCSSFEELARQQQLLAVYRTRCLFVGGERVTFGRLLLKREAERKAFAEMASLKQAETLEKIVAERKRLAQLIVAEKQHSLRVLEAAMAEARAVKRGAKHREMRRYQLDKDAEKATEEVDSRLQDDERNKIMEYYSKLNMQVEKSKMHTEWKIKRLQLDQSRIQLLSTEERNLKREKLELEHQRNEEMAMSIQSVDSNFDVKYGDRMVESTSSTAEVRDSSEDILEEIKSDSPGDEFRIICNATSALGVSETVDRNCDNKKNLDAQGNIISGSESNSNDLKSSDVIGRDLDNAYDNIQYLKMRQEALSNKQKVMAHEFGQVDKENNEMQFPALKVEVDKENNSDDTAPCAEARRNRLKVLGHEFGLKPKAIVVKEAVTDAQKEALINKQKVLGVEYNLPIDITRREPANEAQEEALRNRKKVLGSDYDSKPVEAFGKQENSKRSGLPLNLKSYGETLGELSATTPNTGALTPGEFFPGEEFELPHHRNNSPNCTAPCAEARRNRLKVLGHEFGLKPKAIVVKEAVTDAQKEALINKQKVLGVEYNLPIDITRREPANEAQEEALRNRKKVLGSDYDSKPVEAFGKRENSKRSGLTLNLKSYGETLGELSATTPNTGALTPGEFFPGLDLETPTTADVPLEGAITSEPFTPRSEYGKNADTDKMADKKFINSDGFNFSVIVDDDTVESENASETLTTDSPLNSPLKSADSELEYRKQYSLFNLLDGSYSLEEFDPFGVKDLKNFAKDHFNSKMDLEMVSSCYTHPATIMAEVKKRPYSNIFATHFDAAQEKDEVVTGDNIATLTACLQRSVMLPLTYQLEVVNNSILTFFLVNLDMYEHLRSLKDYFFLMDGEFSRSICRNLFAKLTKTINPQKLLNFAILHNILDKALGSSISHVQKFSENLSFTMVDPPLSFQHSSPDVLQCLSLTYSVQWPLNIILSQEALQRYARVFQFLVKMRRIFWVLGEDFEDLKLTAKLSRHSRALLKSPHYISVQLYRHIMASMIRALDNYIVTTCILSSWTEFEDDLKKARTLDDLYECHVVYIKKVLFRCLLNNRSTPVMKLLNDMFTVILKFSRVLKAGEWRQREPRGHFTHTSFAQLSELYHVFEKLARYLHKVVTKLVECGYQRHLAELLAMVNLNGHYDGARGHDSSAVSNT